MNDDLVKKIDMIDGLIVKLVHDLKLQVTDLGSKVKDRLAELKKEMEDD